MEGVSFVWLSLFILKGPGPGWPVPFHRKLYFRKRRFHVNKISQQILSPLASISISIVECFRQTLALQPVLFHQRRHSPLSATWMKPKVTQHTYRYQSHMPTLAALSEESLTQSNREWSPQHSAAQPRLPRRCNPPPLLVSHTSHRAQPPHSRMTCHLPTAAPKKPTSGSPCCLRIAKPYPGTRESRPTPDSLLENVIASIQHPTSPHGHVSTSTTTLRML
ncbi:hypothetical protein F5882DRAFT_164113 [Hyaloscypha sp. PMI_1271]|nr:hypothetical protein F5882DRAFT_164113 [Hyaloscypha sp. PMI_1271]